MSTADERMRILRLVESGQVSAEEGARLLEAMGGEAARERAHPTPRSLRVLVTDLNTHRNKVNVTIPASLVGMGIKLGAQLLPRIADTPAEQILRAIESGKTGRVFEFHDLEENERIEIFVES
ncbi:MAG: hypothetical protein DIU80_006285 [Chloroflexota bacterium]|nr:MAG: hypothetical protein DIU80_08930 [Chloroflexota bacterium]